MIEYLDTAEDYIVDDEAEEIEDALDDVVEDDFYSDIDNIADIDDDYEDNELLSDEEEDEEDYDLYNEEDYVDYLVLDI